MDERTPTEHRHRPRHRRLNTALLACVVLAIILFGSPSVRSGSHPAATPPTSATAQNTNVPSGTPASDNSTDGQISSIAGSVLDAQPGLAHVTRDIDGDTIVVNLDGKSETIRFIGADTPETHDPRKPVQCYGPEAAAHTKALLEGKNVRLAADPEDSDRDKYGRLLRYVYLPDGTNVNAELIQDGWAFAYIVFPFSMHDQFVSLESGAQAAGRGLWTACNVDSSSEIKQTAGPKT